MWPTTGSMAERRRSSRLMTPAQPAQTRAQDAQFSTMAGELFGVGVAPRHHRRAFGDAEVGLPQPHPVLVGQAIEAFDRRVQQLGVGREGDVLRLHRGVDRDPLKVLAPQRPTGMRHPQALGQQQLQPIAEPLSPMAQVRAFLRELMLEKLNSTPKMLSKGWIPVPLPPPGHFILLLSL